MGFTVFNWRHSVSCLEALGELTRGWDPNRSSDFLDGKERRLQLIRRPLQTNKREITLRRHAGLRFEEMSQSPWRQIDGLAHLSQPQLAEKRSFHQRTDRLHSTITGFRTERFAPTGRSLNCVPCSRHNAQLTSELVPLSSPHGNGRSRKKWGEEKF